MTDLELRSPSECQYDAVALGEVMLRLDPGEARIRTARQFRVSEGGGEYNVIRGLARVFGHRAAIVTALADNEVGHLIEELVLAGGVDLSWATWMPYDGVGRSVRNGLNFTERGFGVRPPLGVSDRGHSAASLLTADRVDWEVLFGDAGVRWLHTGGIFAGLSDSAAGTALAAVEAAHRHGTAVSYDVNFRPSLWRERGGEEAARAVNNEVFKHVDVLIGNPSHPSVHCGEPVPAFVAEGESVLDEFTRQAQRVGESFPSLKVIAATERTVHSASAHDWGALGWSRSSGACRVGLRRGMEIFDRVGGGDAFASGLVHGLLAGAGLATALEYGAAHGALSMTTPGDTSMATAADVLSLAGGGDGRFER